MATKLIDETVDRIGNEPISARMARKAPVRHMDPSLVVITLLLCAYGAVMIYSATQSKQSAAGLDPGGYLKRQVAYAVIAFGVFVVTSVFDYRYLRAFAPFIYVAAVLGLVLVLTPLGVTTQGATRWFALGSFRAQPAEIAKLGVIVALAAYLAERKGEVRARDIAVVVTAVIVPMGLIYLEPDLGTMMVFGALTGALLLVGGAKIRHFLALGLMGAGAVVLVLQLGFLQDYQLERLTAFLDPTPDVQSEGYNAFQAKVAIATGGMEGRGLGGNNTQTALDFIPEQHTDFIFTAIGEQLGFIGSAALLGLFALLIWRALRIAAMSRDIFGSLLAGGIAALWIFQIFINIGMTMGIMPITGLTLPFVSFGGSSMVVNFLSVGLLLNIHMRRYL